MVPARKISVVSPVSVAFISILCLSFVMTVLSGIIMNRAMQGADFDMASKLKTAHLASGVIFILLGMVHCWQRRFWFARLLRQATTWRLEADQRVIPLYLALFLCVTVSAVLILCGVRGAIPFHCGSALLFSVLAIFHLTLNFGTPKRKKS